MRIRNLLRCALAAALVCPAAFAQTARTPAKMLVGYPPGGAVDVLGRMFAEPMSEALGRTVIVENRPGAVGQIAAEALKAATPDGNTLMVAPDATVVIRPQTLSKPPFDPFADFAPVAHTGNWAFALGIHAGLPAKTLADYVSWVKADSARASFASSGAGGSTHFFGVLLGQTLGVPLVQVPYKGAGPAILDVVAGHIPATIQPLGTLLAQAKGGKIAVLGMSGRERSPAAPEVPTFAELGHPELTADGWFGIFAPAGTPAETVAKLNAAFARAMRASAVKDKMRNLDLEVREMSAAEFAAVVRAGYDRWGPIIRASGFRGDAP
ncbi:MAG TPA: tripartite tricarboxylate transporter substrate-binding protein [Burkholderiales bacterium]|jgi:tripartite-type tricarboxylate transporter receptor subunit TctC|nr:tripartite tricarboxylate transporter substrate-binding protein [Burkholderiales bacterium]